MTVAGIVFAANMFAQNAATVTGTIVDAKGVPVIGAALTVNGVLSTGTVSDMDGKYSIRVNDIKKDVLVVSSIGFKTNNVQLTGDVVVNIVMEEDNEMLDEVVVVGYGAMRRSDLTGSVTSVKINEDEARRSTSVDQLLQGKAAGVAVTNNSGAPDGGVSIRIRGTSTFNGDVQPLFVVDGIIMNPASSTEAGTTRAEGDMNEETNGLVGINPQDIASMEVLKDASATAIYGALGANGVVLITTKSANRDKPTVNFSAGVDVSTLYAKQEMMNLDMYCDYLGALGTTAAKNRLNSIATVLPDGSREYKVTPMDWQDELIHTAVSQRYYLSIAGRPKTMSYFFSFGYTDKQGLVQDTGMKQFTARLNIDKSFGKIVKIGTKTNLAFVQSSRFNGATKNGVGASSSIFRSMLSYRPYVGIKEDEDDDPEVSAGRPDIWISDTKNQNVQYRIQPNIYLQVKILPWLSFKSTFGADYKVNNKTSFKSSRINSANSGSVSAFSNTTQYSWNFDNMFLFDNKFRGGHSLSGTLGMTAHEAFGATQFTQPYNIIQWKALDESANGAQYSDFSYTESKSTTLSFLARAIYNFKDRYVVTATGRADGSSRFQGNNKFAFFPSFAFAWRMSEEPWFNAPVLSMTKIRLGYGQVGNQAVANYRTLTNYASEKMPSHIGGDTDKGFIRTLYPSNLANSDLKWETTEQFNAGLDMSFWKGRLSLTVDAYYKLTRDLLQYVTISSASGYSNIWVNNGSISNKGIEFTLGAVPIKAGAFEWSLDGNISFNRNRVESIRSDQQPLPIYMTQDCKNHTFSKEGVTYTATDVRYFVGDLIGSGSLANGVANIFMEGYPVGLFYGYATDGIVQEGETGPQFSGTTPMGPGSVKYLDLNQNGKMDENDRAIIGDPNPDFTYGFSTTFSYKGISLTANFAGSHGNDIMNINRMASEGLSTESQNHSVVAFKNAWTPENPNTWYPAVKQSSNADRIYISDRFVEDASYLRLANLTLSYVIPINAKKSKVVKGITVSGSANNLKVWSKYSGWDPEVNSYGSNMFKYAVDFNSYPSSRTFSFDVKFTF